jgi:hypothetical protein
MNKITKELLRMKKEWEREVIDRMSEWNKGSKEENWKEWERMNEEKKEKVVREKKDKVVKEKKEKVVRDKKEKVVREKKQAGRPKKKKEVIESSEREEEEERVEVRRREIQGVKYLVSTKTKAVYDLETNEEIGKWDEERDRVEFNQEEVEEMIE